jgi:Protein of unknown function (DUF2975)
MFRKNISLIAITIAAAFTLYFFFLIKSVLSGSANTPPMFRTISLPEGDTAFGGLFFDPQINDSLPHYQYKCIDDSIKRIKKLIEINNKSTGNGRSVGAFGVTEIKRDWSLDLNNDISKDSVLRGLVDSMDLLSIRMVSLKESDSLSTIQKLMDEIHRRSTARHNEVLQQEKQREEKFYYLALEGYRIEDHNTQFFLDKNDYNLAYVVWDTVVKRTFDSTKQGHYERKRISVRYAADDQRVLVPITKKHYHLISNALTFGGYFIIFLLVYFFVGLPFQIIINISKGKAFTLKNIYRFKLMAVVLLIYGLMSVAAPYLLKLIYNNIIPEEFALKPFTQTFFSYLPFLLSSLGLFLISKAFQRGYNLQQENALTI